jgi:hypothetical protein
MHIIHPCPAVLCPQDDIYQPWEDQLAYSEFSVRLPHSSIPDIVPLLSEVSDEDYLQLRAGLVEHWRAFVWDKAIGGTAVSRQQFGCLPETPSQERGSP